MRNCVWVQECGKSGPGARAEGEGRGPSMGLACEGSEVGWARLRCLGSRWESAPRKLARNSIG